MNLPTATKKNKNLIIWAVDPTKKVEDAKNIIKELSIWSKHLNCEVQPVSVFIQSAFSYPLELAFPSSVDFKKEAQRTLNSFMKKANTKDFLTPELIFVTALSNRRMASEVAKYAEKKNANLIFANTHAKSTWNPFRLGGFAETLIATSKVPVLLLNPNAVASEKIPTILYPTDFSAESKNALLKQINPIAKSFKSNLLLYSQVETPNIYPIEFYGAWQGDFSSAESIMKDVESARLKKSRQWLNQLQKENINCSALIQRETKNLASDIITAAKKNKAGLISIAIQNHPSTLGFLSSVARDVLVQAKCPILVFHIPQEHHKETARSVYPNGNSKYITPKEKSPQQGVSHG
ncbi:MAG: universal stress protein [Pseudobdellovibrio sp.]